MTNYEAERKIEGMIFKGGCLVATEPQQIDCSFYCGTEKQYCKATTMTKCTGCRFYKPSLFVQRKLLVEEIARLEDLRDMLIEQNKVSTAALAAQTKALDKMRYEERLYMELRTKRVEEAAAIGRSIQRHRKKIKKTTAAKEEEK